MLKRLSLGVALAAIFALTACEKYHFSKPTGQPGGTAPKYTLKEGITDPATDPNPDPNPDPTTDPTVDLTEDGNSFSVGGTVSGLAGAGIVLKMNDEVLPISANGSFTFSTKLASGAAFEVSVPIQASVPRQLCTVSKGSGKVEREDLTSIAVNCVTPPSKFAYILSDLPTVFGDAEYATIAASLNKVCLPQLPETLKVFSIDPSTGSLTKLARLWAKGTAAPTGIRSVAVDPAGRFAYIVTASGSIGSYSIGSDGALSEIGRQTIEGAGSISLDPLARFAYVILNPQSARFVVIPIEPTGRLSAQAKPIINPMAVSITPPGIVTDPTGRFIYVIGTKVTGGTGVVASSAPSIVSSISAYSIGGDSILTHINDISIAGYAPFVTVELGAKVLYSTNYTAKTIGAYAIGTDGKLSLIAETKSGSGPAQPVIDPGNKYLYAVNYDDDNVSTYSIEPDGSLKASSLANASTGPVSLWIDPGNKYAYAANSDAETVTSFSIGANGSLVFLAQNPIQNLSYSKTLPPIVFDPTGLFAYSANNTIDPAPVKCAVGSSVCGPTGGEVSAYKLDQGKMLAPQVTNISKEALSCAQRFNNSITDNISITLTTGPM